MLYLFIKILKTCLLMLLITCSLERHVLAYLLACCGDGYAAVDVVKTAVITGDVHCY